MCFYMCILYMCIAIHSVYHSVIACCEAPCAITRVRLLIHRVVVIYGLARGNCCVNGEPSMLVSNSSRCFILNVIAVTFVEPIE